MLQELEGQIMATGKARRTRYALRMPLRGDLAELPLYEIDKAGRAELLTSVALVHPHGTCVSLANTGWPIPDESRDGWWDGLPYPRCTTCAPKAKWAASSLALNTSNWPSPQTRKSGLTPTCSTC